MNQKCSFTLYASKGGWWRQRVTIMKNKLPCFPLAYSTSYCNVSFVRSGVEDLQLHNLASKVWVCF